MMGSHISNWHLFYLVLIAVPYKAYSGPLTKRSEVSALDSGTAVAGTLSMSSVLASMSSMGAASVPSDLASASMSHGMTALDGSGAGSSPTATKTSAQPYETLDYGPVNTPDEGYKYGNATIVNQCDVAVKVQPIGGFRLGGCRTDTEGYSTPEEQVFYPIAPGENYSESFRSTWVAPDDTTNSRNPDTDKLWGQGISLKISWADRPHDQNITQFEYAFTHNPKAQQNYPLLWYDVSLLDCGMPANTASIDFTATDADYKAKTEQCPGYQGGLTLTFESCECFSNTCPEIDCEGECRDIYNFDRTRELEPTKQCESEFKGEMILHLCAGNV